jgi:hypothetical protein
MIANQLNHPSGNAVGVVLPGVPVGTTLQKWNEKAQSYDVPNVVLGGGWSDPTMTSEAAW